MEPGDRLRVGRCAVCVKGSSLRSRRSIKTPRAAPFRRGLRRGDPQRVNARAATESA